MEQLLGSFIGAILGLVILGVVWLLVDAKTKSKWHRRVKCHGCGAILQATILENDLFHKEEICPKCGNSRMTTTICRRANGAWLEKHG